MEQVILIRFSEIHLKGKNKGYFLKLLYTNIKTALKEFKKVITPIQNRVVVSDYNPEDEDTIIAEIKKVFGVYSVSVASVISSTVEDITALTNINEKDLKNIANSILDFDSAVEETSIALSTIGERTSISDRISNVIENTFATIGSNIAESPGQLTTWMLTGLLQSSGIADSLKQSVLGTTIDPVGILRAGIVGLNAISEIPAILQGLSGKNALNLGDIWGAIRF